MGAVLILLGFAVLVFDRWSPWYPTLLVLAVVAGLLAIHELVGLLPEPRPRLTVCLGGGLLVLLANWPAHVGLAGSPWLWVAGGAAAALGLAFVVEAVCFREPGGAVHRIALAYWAVAYVGLLASFLLQLRWLPGGAFALALAIFVPKGCDIGAYFMGRFLGRHRMTPVLSPKKTWEGAAGGLAAAVAVAVGLNGWSAATLEQPLLCWPGAVGFGLAVGVAGMLGDLMESLIKRDCARKDASETVPGFGGVLDVLDSILFSAPVAYAFILLVGNHA
jgi:phosphatidate cytidylyltransferase